MRLENKNIAISVSGGIAAYKSVELLRNLQKEGADVKIVMTKNATAFIAPLTFAALSGHEVLIDLFNNKKKSSISHIELARESDAVVIAPATANIIGKIANGIADDAVTTFIMAVSAPKLIAPAMNSNMYENMSVQRNIAKLEADGYTIIEPSVGDLACKAIGPGRLASPEKITDRIIKAVSKKDLKNKKILVSAGPTREHIDPVRYISNPSSGKMGFAIAAAAEQRGAEVTLVSGPTELPDPFDVNVVKVSSAEQMAKAIFAYAESADIIIKAAAVSDYRAVDRFGHKIKKTENDMTLKFCRNIDILKELGSRKKKQILIGFAAETEELQKNAEKKLAEKNLDMIVGNIVGKEGTGFQADTNSITLFFKKGKKKELPNMSKHEVAHNILDSLNLL